MTSGGIGYPTGTSIALAYLAPDLAEPGTLLEVEVFGERIGATVAAGPLYDPRGKRIRA